MYIEQVAEENSLPWINTKWQILLSFKQTVQRTIILFVFWLIHRLVFLFPKIIPIFKLTVWFYITSFNSFPTLWNSIGK